MVIVARAETDATTLGAALAYARRGWHVFPVGSNKRPRIPEAEGGRGYLDATTDEQTIVGWWRRYPSAQIGVACGASGLVVVDLDVDPAKSTDGVEALGAHLGTSPDRCELVAVTPRGGRHLIYADTAGRYGIGADVGCLRGVDVRGSGGYIVVPSPASPGRKWHLGDWTNAADLVAPPPELVDILPPARGGRGISKGTGKMVPADPARDDMLQRARSALDTIPPSIKRPQWLSAIRGFHAAVEADERGAEIVEEWSARTDVPGQYKEGEAHGTYATSVLPWQAPQGMRLVEEGTLFFMAGEHGWDGALDDVALAEIAEAAEPAPADHQMPFPMDLLAGDDMVAQAARWMLDSAPRRQPVFAYAAALSAIGAILGRRVQTETRLRTNFYILAVGESGSGKEHPSTCAQELLHAAGQGELVGPGEFRSDASVYAALRSRPSLLAPIDEAGKLLGQINGRQAPAYLAGINRALLELFTKAGRTVQPAAYADPKMHSMDPLLEPCLGVLGSTTPTTLFEGMTSAQITDGFLGRALAFPTDDQFPNRRRGAMCYPPPDDLVQRVKLLAAATAPQGLCGKTSDGTTATGCRTVPFTDDARERWFDIGDEGDEHVRRLTDEGSPLVALWKRRGEHVAKVALTLALAGDPHAPAIGIHDVDRADRLVTWCLSRLHRDVDRGVADSDFQRRVQKVLKVITDGGVKGVTGTALARRTQWLRPPERKEVLLSLVEAGHVEMTSLPPNRADGSGKPTLLWRVRGA